MYDNDITGLSYFFILLLLFIIMIIIIFYLINVFVLQQINDSNMKGQYNKLRTIIKNKIKKILN